MNFGAISGKTWLAGGLAGGVAFLGMQQAMGYDFGSARQIGPAVFPFGLSLILLLAAIGILAEDIITKARHDGPATAPIIVLAGVLGGPVAFALLVESFGLVPAIFGCVLIASVADRALTLVTALLLAAAMSLICGLVFVSLLNLPIDLFAMPR